MNKVLKLLLVLLLGSNLAFGAQNQISTEFQIHIPKFLSIKPVTSPVLYANITNRTGNLYSPLSTTFRVVTNTPTSETLYLSGKVDTLSGREEGFFEFGGQVYLAFTYASGMVEHSDLVRCKYGEKESKGVVAYPVLYVNGADSKFIPSKSKYEITIKNGVHDITLYIGSNVLRNSFDPSDKNGLYKAEITLTESDI